MSGANRHANGTNPSHLRDGKPRSVPEGGPSAPIPGAGPGARHLYVHLPFCAHRCGYCDFVTVVGRDRDHSAYVDALLAELELERGLLADPVDTVFLGGGTPTVTGPSALARLFAGLPRAAETTVEANPETVTPELAALLRERGVNRISLGAQSFQPHLL
jgi:oxygen-independent coproporphyrinogen-3 oxidase